MAHGALCACCPHSPSAPSSSVNLGLPLLGPLLPLHCSVPKVWNETGPQQAVHECAPNVLRITELTLQGVGRRRKEVGQ